MADPRGIARLATDGRLIAGLLAGLALLMTALPADAGRRGASIAHAYLTDYGDGNSGGGALWQFDVNDGIAVAPGHIVVSGLHQPLGVAVGADGIVYVAESAYMWHAIDVYRIAGRTARLLRQITFGSGFQPAPEYLAVDARNYLYAAMNYSNIAVFRPGERGYVAMPNYLENDGGAYQIGVDERGDVYQPSLDQLFVHLNRPDHLARPGTRLVDPVESGWTTLMIARADGSDVYVGTGSISRTWISVAALPIHRWGRIRVERSLILANGCRAGGDVLGLSLAVANGFLYEICGYFTRSHAYVRGIWTFAAGGNGTVNALHFAKADVATPGDIAIGP
jgi:hypothetical protein